MPSNSQTLPVSQTLPPTGHACQIWNTARMNPGPLCLAPDWEKDVAAPVPAVKKAGSGANRLGEIFTAEDLRNGGVLEDSTDGLSNDRSDRKDLQLFDSPVRPQRKGISDDHF